MEEVKIAVPIMTISQYAKHTELSRAMVKTLCENNILPAYKTEGGHWRIKVFNNSVSQEEYEKVLQENAFLKSKLKSLKAILENI